MNEIKKGDMVSRNSYNNDIIFYVKSIIKTVDSKKIAILKGIDVRIEADALIEDLQFIPRKKYKINEKNQINIEKKFIENKRHNKKKEMIHTGKILHLDGDKRYSQKSVMYYKKMGLNAVVKNVPEHKQPKVVYRLLNINNPEILIITGHDRND